ncbi:MAG: hypothetical protein JWR80_1424 [Bradyrhizobium sp.]|nr:hypothetical protein [Bradyrhizobium sp.]
MTAFHSILLAAVILATTGFGAFADTRVALVIGNSAYQKVAKLANPANDAAAVAAMFKSAGFDAVDTKLNLTANELRKALREFGNKSRNADMAVVYYAGHGIELDGNNYLIPVDATLDTDADVLDETLPLDRILFAVEPARKLRLVILDACRDNPFARAMKRTTASRAIGRGLAKVEPSSPNTMIAFAAKAGSTASDGDSTNSPFATALIDHLAKPGLDLRKAFGFVRDDVLKATNNSQEPFIYGSLGGNDVSLVPAAAAIAVPFDQDLPMRRDYEFALQVSSKSAWDAFIEKHPSGFYTALAKAQRDKLAAEAVRIEIANKARAAQEEQSRLAIEGAKAAEQARAAEQTKAAGKALIAAELAKRAEEAKVAEAERAKSVAVAKAAEDARAAEVAREKVGKQGPVERTGEQLAALPSPADKSDRPSAVDLARLLQVELRRVGCNTSEADGNWNAVSQRSLFLFNQYAGMKLDVSVASIAALDAVKSQSSRTCPLICDHGFKPDGGRCIKITCRAGYELGDSNACDRIKTKGPAAKRDALRSRQVPSENPKSETQATKPQASGQVFCDSQGCRPVRKGCSVSVGLPVGSTARARLGAGGLFEVCN